MNDTNIFITSHICKDLNNTLNNECFELANIKYVELKYLQNTLHVIPSCTFKYE